MTKSSPTRDSIQYNIAVQMADHLNQSVEELLEEGVQKMGKSTQLPLLKLIEVVQSRHLRTMSLFLKRRYPWISSTDVSLGCSSQSKEEKQSQLQEEIDKRIRSVSLSLDAVAGLSVTAPRTSEQLSVFEYMVQQLTPYALHQLQKYVEWQKKEAKEGQAEAEAKLEIIDATWRSLCVTYGVDLSSSKEQNTWKGLFIATYFRLHCLNLSSKQNLERLPALALFLDNREMLERSGAMDIVG